jgi:hypothetical protein
VNGSETFGGARSPIPVRLLQIDVAVKDNRAAGTTGWVFGTFNYNSAAPGSTAWQRMIPIGLMWGNDPLLTPAQFRANKRPQQSKVLFANVMANLDTAWRGSRLVGAAQRPYR